MRGGRPTLQLGESWVVEGHDEHEEYLPLNEVDYDHRARTSTPRRSIRGNNRSPDPEFVMPSLDAETLEASWSQGESTSRSPRRFQESRRRNSRHDLDHENLTKRPRTQQAHDRSPLVPSTTNSNTPHHPNSDMKDVITVFFDHVMAAFTWILEILGGALRLLRTPLSYLLAISILYGFALVARSLFTTSIYASLSPICRLPGLSLLSLPFCSVYNGDSSNGARFPVEFEQVMIVQSQFEDILKESAGGVSLPLDMKRGESFLRDLRQLVRYSQLKSR
ncbi:hypothetical protein EYC80_004125 [Monilinia laxa]|nr:hypothetical protein EYC80_004125 [Monilinia laxa]